MHLISDFSEYVSNISGIDKEYIKLTILTIFVILIAEIIKWIAKNIYSHMPVSDKKKFFRNRKSRIIISVISFVVVPSVVRFSHGNSNVIFDLYFILFI